MMTKGNILYMDNNESCLSMFSCLIRDQGYESVTCANHFELLYYLIADKALSVKKCVTAEDIFSEFESALSSMNIYLSSQTPQFRDYFQSRNPRLLDALILDEMAEPKTEQYISLAKDLDDHIISKEEYFAKTKVLEYTQIENVKKTLIMVSFARKIGCEKPIIVRNEMEKI